MASIVAKNARSLPIIVRPGYDVWVYDDTQFWLVPHDHETAGLDQTVLDVAADVVVAVQKIWVS